MAKDNFFSLKSSDKFGQIFRLSEETLFQGFPYEPGWYFWDIDDEPFGPFLHEEQTKVALRLYTAKLMTGEIKPKPRTVLRLGPGQTWN